MHRMPRFTLYGLMTIVTGAAFCLAIGRVCGLILGTFFVTLIMCYVLASFLSPRAPFAQRAPRVLRCSRGLAWDTVPLP
jgi:hypothetical protein